jgi:hypothetical protein
MGVGRVVNPEIAICHLIDTNADKHLNRGMAW